MFPLKIKYIILKLLNLSIYFHVFLKQPIRPGLYLGQITSGKRMSAQNWKHPNRNMQKFFKIMKQLVKAQYVQSNQS